MSVKQRVNKLYYVTSLSVCMYYILYIDMYKHTHHLMERDVKIGALLYIVTKM